MYARHIAPLLQAALADTPIVFLHGARQTGKSTLCQWLARNGYPAGYLTLDDITVLAAARTDPAGFINGLLTPIILDEIQRAPELFLPLKARVDQDRRPGQFLLTGSAHALLLPQLAESLAGRMEILTLWPFSQGELAGSRETFIDSLFADSFSPAPSGAPSPGLMAAVLRGGYPEAGSRASEKRRQAWFRSYLTAILQRDIRDLAEIHGLTELPALLSVLAARSSSLLNFAELARSCGLPQTTLKRYASLLEMTFLIQKIPAWSGNFSKRLLKSPKVFLCDTGLMAYLLGIDEHSLERERSLLGSLLETFVVTELQKQITWSQTQPALFHFRTTTDIEVDVVLENRAGQLVGLEVKSAATVQKKDFKGLHYLQETCGSRWHRGIVLYTGNQTISFGSNLYAAPIHSVWAARSPDRE